MHVTIYTRIQQTPAVTHRHMLEQLRTERGALMQIDRQTDRPTDGESRQKGGREGETERERERVREVDTD
jgi:hypothetical protein